MKSNNSATATSRKQRAWQGVCTAFALASQTFHTSRLFAMFLRLTEGKVLPHAVLHSLVVKTRRRVEWQSSATSSLAQLGGEDTTPCRVAKFCHTQSCTAWWWRHDAVSSGKVLPHAVLHSLVVKTRRRVEWQLVRRNQFSQKLILRLSWSWNLLAHPKFVDVLGATVDPETSSGN
jgi:branched-subunit amino acid transport protein AzlD